MIKNYIILLLVSILFIFLTWWLISQYAQSKEEQTFFLQHEIAEIKATNLENYLLETPNTIILLIFDSEEELLTELAMFLSEHNIVQNTVYLDLNKVTEEDITRIEDNLQVSFAIIENQNLILVIDDFVIVDKTNITDDEVKLLTFFKKWNYIDD